jgi:GAF domain-containing protein/biotin carboxyl carrier protein
MKEVLQTWFKQQCCMLTGSVRGALLTGEPDEGPYNQILFWPEKQGDYNALSLVARAALHNRHAVIKTRNGQVEKTGEPLDALACPLLLEGRLLGVMALEMTHRSHPLQKAAVQQVQAGAKWLETMVRLHGSTAKEQLVHLVDLVAAGLEHEQFRVAASEVANLLAELFACHRVSLGFLSNNRLRVEAMSHSSQVDQHSNLLRAIREAMVEAMDQVDTVVYPAKSDDSILITRFHSRLGKMQHGASICTLPLVKSGKAVGALMLERTEDKPFAPEAVEQCEQISLLLGPVLETRRRDERPLPLRIFDSLRSGCANLFGPRYLPLKGISAVSVAMLILLTLVQGTLRISCEAVLEPGIRRVVVAPQQGYIATARATAGDLVQQGDLLATLDDQELRLEQRKWQSQRAQLQKEYRKALAGSDRAGVAILNAKRAQAEAQLKLVDQQLMRTTLTAPFPGLIVKGDLTQCLGSPVTRGEVLYEVAPTNKYRVVLKVDDRDIGLVAKGQRGHLKLSGIPVQTIAIAIDRLTPVATAREGRNFFRVEATMDAHSDLMRPGMEGICKIEIGQEKLLWIWTRRLVDWLRMFAWNRIP